MNKSDPFPQLFKDFPASSRSPRAHRQLTVRCTTNSATKICIKFACKMLMMQNRNFVPVHPSARVLLSCAVGIYQPCQTQTVSNRANFYLLSALTEIVSRIDAEREQISPAATPTHPLRFRAMCWFLHSDSYFYNRFCPLVCRLLLCIVLQIEFAYH